MMASQLLHNYHHHLHNQHSISIPTRPNWRFSHRRTFFSPKQIHDLKNYKKFVYRSPKHERFTTIKAILENSPTNEFTSPTRDENSPTSEVTSPEPNNENSPRNEVTSPTASNGNSRTIHEVLSASPRKAESFPERVVDSILTPTDKYTHKTIVRAKFDENQLTIFNHVKAKLLLELVPAELDQKTGLKRESIKKEANGKRKGNEMEFEMEFEADFEIPVDFGEIGAVIIRNEHDKEIYVYDINVIHLRGTITIPCNSWVHSQNDNSIDNRIFFTNKSYLPSQTPSGLMRLREEELNVLRGRGDGERKEFDRVYDYDVYNDLGDPDTDKDLSRPILGGNEYAYPRRCRTGRPRCKEDPMSESRSSFVYVPRDEAFSEVKSDSFGKNKVSAFTRAIFSSLMAAVTDKEFAYFTKIDELFGEGVNIKVNSELDLLNILPMIIESISKAGDCLLRFKVPQLMDKDRFSWLRDEEFCRQTLAGVNPFSIQLVKEWPLVSKLDPKVYGPPESAITKEMVEQQLNGHMTLEEAIKQKKLFIIDYHDILLPYVNKVRDIKGTTLYGSRTLMFLKPTDELMPIAIELTRPPANKQPQWKQVFVPSSDATSSWLWKLAKVHVLAHDSGYHQLVSHWLRTHCATEPYVIATNRQLSAMHPIYRLLHPHLRYTMEINAEARKSLVNAGGVIESGFAPAKYSMELSCIAYNQWRFDLEALPADLIYRGMAVEDPSAPHGLKLAIEDYPYASDGLILWDAIEEWVSSYVNHYYSTDQTLIESDHELQAWWNEIRTVGHGDKKDGWPVLKTPKDLIKILTIMIWVTAGHHSAVNFGQYGYAGYFPNRPAIARTKMPTEDCSDEEWKRFVNKPEQAFLACLPSVPQATIVMAILSVLSDHASDEEYIGQNIEPSWNEDPVIKSSFEIFSARLMMLKATIDRRNADKNFKNRTGVGLVPYQLLSPLSEPGVTGKGVPNSISI